MLFICYVTLSSFSIYFVSNPVQLNNLLKYNYFRDYFYIIGYKTVLIALAIPFILIDSSIILIIYKRLSEENLLTSKMLKIVSWGGYLTLK